MPTRPDRAFLAFTACIAALALGHAIEINDGRYAVEALPWLTVALVAAFLGVTFRVPHDLERLSEQLLPPLAVGGLVWQATSWLLASKLVKFLEPTDAWQVLPVYVCILALTGVGVWAAHRSNDLQSPRVWSGCILGLACAVLTIWVVLMAPHTSIDVRVFHDEALKALLHGDNPFAISMPNIYPGSGLYAPGLVDNGRIQAGYVYPPVNLLLGWWGYVLGDVRYAMGAAWTLCVLLISRLTSHKQAVLAASLFALTPRGLLVIEMAWIEPFVLLFAVCIAWCAGRNARGLACAVGLFAVSKQYAPLLAPAVFLLPTFRGARWSILLFKAAVCGLAVTLPFVLWSPQSFYRSVWLFHSTAGLRHDSLNYVAWWSNFNGQRVPDLFWGKVLGVLAMGWSLQRAPTTVAGMAMAMGFSCLVLIAFNNVAFCNYYWFMIGCFFTAMASTRLTR